MFFQFDFPQVQTQIHPSKKETIESENRIFKTLVCFKLFQTQPNSRNLQKKCKFQTIWWNPQTLENICVQ